MGGDNGPAVIVPAALKALAYDTNLKIILVGPRDVLQAMLQQHSAMDNPRIVLQEASQVVGMDEAPAVAMRTKRDSSMRVAINLVKEKKAHACVSAGNTGALMAIARFVLKMLPHIDRPAIISCLPTLDKKVYVLDLGANVDCTANHLLQFAVMGATLVKNLEGISNPKVGLLNIGSEAIKGSEVIKQAAVLLGNKTNLNYIGFIEGDDIYKGLADVVVCDGFVGNVALKTSEGLARMIFSYAKQEFTASWYRKFIVLLAAPILKKLIKRFDPSQYNGASLLGLNGIVIKSHGNAGIEAFFSAICAAQKEVEKNVSALLQEQVVACFKEITS